VSGKQWTVHVATLNETTLSAEADVPESTGVNFIKIDAEGDEEKIWAGMQSLVEGKDLRAMLMEWTPKRYEDPKRFLAEIEAARFRVGVVDGAGGVQPAVGDITELDGFLDLWLER
jgi:hypothetical protein